MSVLLSAVLIVRDEEAVLGRCLRSLEGIVDEVVVVDTGSVDRSPEIAANHGAHLFFQPWNNDFAEARNVALGKATGKWVLYIDADESLSRVDRPLVERLLTHASEVAFRILLRPHSAMTPYLEYRLWRSDPRIRFEGLIHERVVPAIHRVAQSDGRPVSDCHLLLLEHIGYEGDQTRKHLRNLPMLRRFVAKQPDHLFAQNHLATVLDALGRRAEAQEVLWNTLELIRTQPFVDPVGVLIYTNLIYGLSGEGQPVEPLLSEALWRYPDNCALLFIEGRQLIDRGDYGQALERFERILDIGVAGPAVGKPAYDLTLVGEYSHACRALCLFRLRRYEEAADAFAEAQRLAPNDPSYGVRRRLAQSRADRGSDDDPGERATAS